jgi:uroporphyrinogen-III decarboxylase
MEENPMNSHERTTIALNLGAPDRVPVFSCTEEQNQIYEILGNKGGALPLKLIREGVTGAMFKLTSPLINRIGWMTSETEKFMSRKLEVDIALGYDCSWLMYSAIFNLKGNRQSTDIWGKLYDLVADPDGNVDTPMYREGLLTTPELWDAWPHPDPDKFFKIIYRVFADLQKRYGDKIYLMGSLFSGLWESASQSMGLTAFSVILRRNPDFVRRMVKYYEEIYMATIHATAEAGMPAFIYSDDMGHKSGPQMPPRILEEFFGPSLRRICQEAHKRGIKIIIHSCGNVNLLLDLFADWGFDGVHSLEPTAGIDLAAVKQRLGKRMCIFGNMDISHILSEGTREEVESAVKTMLKAAALDGGFIMAMTNSHNAVKVENTRWMIEDTHRYGVYPIRLA